MTAQSSRIMHPHIAVDINTCGGSPVIRAVQFPVRLVVFYVLQLGLDPEHFVKQFPHLTLAHVHDALAYYYDNRQEVEADMAAHREELERHRTTFIDEIRRAMRDAIAELRRPV
jgi:uncharacterized protein (DUF433 family)